MTYYLPKAPSPNSISLGIRDSSVNFGRKYTNMQFIEQFNGGEDMPTKL